MLLFWMAFLEKRKEGIYVYELQLGWNGKTFI